MYSDIYKNNFDWGNLETLSSPSKMSSIDKFVRHGFVRSDAVNLVDSGFYFLPDGFDQEVIIDRYYGGCLASADCKTRIPLGLFMKQLSNRQQCKFPTITVTSEPELWARIDEFQKKYDDGLLFRGQTKVYKLDRKINNPNMLSNGIEHSLLPSFYRRSLSVNSDFFSDFPGFSPFEWSSVFRQYYNFDEMNDRAKVEFGDEWAFMTYSDYEECSDPILREFGKFQLDFQLGGREVEDRLNTYMQHYGLDTHYLDLSNNPEVALFFATHKFAQNEAGAYYEFVGANDKSSILYLLRHDAVEMAKHTEDEFSQLIGALRPIRQSCVVCRSSSWAVNLPADFIVAAIRLDFDLTRSFKLTAVDIFPSIDEDRFLSAIKPVGGERVTEFGCS